MGMSHSMFIVDVEQMVGDRKVLKRLSALRQS